MDIEGSFVLQGSPERVYGYLVDPGFIGDHLADVENVEVIDNDNFNVRAKVGIGFMKGKVDFKFHFDEKVAPKSGKLVGNGTGLGSKVDVTILFTLADGGESTTIGWKSHASLSGKIASIAGGALQSVVKKNTQRFIESIKQGIDAELSAAGAAAGRS